MLYTIVILLFICSTEEYSNSQKHDFIYLFIYLQTSPKTIWQEGSHRTIVPITRLLNIKKKKKKKKETSNDMIQNS